MWYATRPPMKITRAENGNIEHPQILMNAAGAQIFNTAVTLHPPSYNVNAQFISCQILLKYIYREQKQEIKC
jgi:hypothetical protein